MALCPGNPGPANLARSRVSGWPPTGGPEKAAQYSSRFRTCNPLALQHKGVGAAPIRRTGRPCRVSLLVQLDLDIDAGGQLEAHECVHGLVRRVDDVHQPLVRERSQAIDFR